ncbi:hypothetical protein KSS87_014501 [Heliosperma pusillum]|nr:hypothetical protein KSS87_014501 [Heliosperma pusillum]
MTAMSKVGGGWTEPQAFHRFCTRHQASNINTKFKSNELKLAFLSTACVAQRKRFNKGMQKIGSLNPRAKVLLESIPLSKWSLCHDGGHRYSIKTTNNSECFNGVLKRVRFLPITALVKATFFRINSYFVKHREDANKRLLEGCMWSEKVTEELAENVKRAAHHKVTCYDARRGLYAVVTGRGNRLGSEVCRANSISSDQYVDPFYSCGDYHGSYRSSFHPVPDESYWMPWVRPKLTPNDSMKRAKGRPKSKRIHNEMDQRATSSCSLCRVAGHNKRSCPSKASSSQTIEFTIWIPDPMMEQFFISNRLTVVRRFGKEKNSNLSPYADPLLLLQLWSWERVSIGRPDIVRSRVPRQAGVAYPLGSQVLTGLDPLGCKWLRVQRGFKDHRLGLVVIRDLLDKMVELQFVWQPYTPSVVQHLSPICVQDQAEWTVIAPLICFEMVEWHFPNRCTRQFGWQQMIPEMGNTCTRLHGISRKGDWSGNYETMHQESIAKWENRMSNIVEPGLPFCGLMSFEDEYFEWYNAITRRIITPLSQTVNDDYEDHHYYYPTAADFQILTQTSMVTYNTTEQMISNMPDDIPLAQYAMIEKMRNMSLNSLVNTGQGHLINYQEPRPPSPPRYDFRHLAHRQQVMTQESEEAESSQRTRKKGKKRN